MGATSKTFQITITATGTTYDISAIDLITVETSGAGAKILYNVDGSAPTTAIVNETALAISTASGYLIPLTYTDTSTTFYINIDRIRDVVTNGSAAYVYYNQGNAEDVKYSVNETRAAIRTLIAAVVTSGGGTVTTGITAFAGGGQSSATQLTYGYSEITTVATALDSVKLPAGVVGAVVTLENDGANIANVYPATSGTINDGSANAAIPIAPGVTLVFTNIDATNWETTAQKVAVPDGTVSLPSFTFEADNDTGFYRIGANNIGVTANGAKVLDIATTGLSTTGTSNFTTTQTGGATTSITAFAGGGQGSAVALTTDFNEITVCATAGDSVKLPTAVLGLAITVFNDGTTAADVFPNTSGTINDGSANAAVRIAPQQTITFKGTSTTNWEANNQVLGAGDGAVSTPSHTYSTQPNMGFYKVSSAQQGVSVGGALATLFDASGVMSDSIRNRVNLGTTPVGTVSIVEYSTGKHVVAVLTLTNFITGALAGAAAALGMGNIVYALPAGVQLWEVCYSSLALTAAGTAVTPKLGLGTVIASGAVSVLNGTATFMNYQTEYTAGSTSTHAVVVNGPVAATAGYATGISLQTAASIKNVFLNAAATWNADNTGNLTATGTIVIKWTSLA